MAKSYSFSEACEIIAAGTDFEAIAEIGHRYPILLRKIAIVVAKAGDSFVDLMSFMPDYMTANKINSAIKATIVESDDANEGNEVEAEAEATEIADEAEASEDTANTNYESMSNKELWELLGKAGKRKVAKSTKKADLVEACKKVFGNNAEAEIEESEEDDTGSKNPYDGKSAMELFKECKKRGIKVASKKPAKFYVDLLVKADMKADESAEDDDSWDDEPVPAEKPAKESKKAAKENKKAAAKKEENTDDEDDDWDI